MALIPNTKLEDLVNDKFAVIVTLSKALDAAFDFGEENDIFVLANLLRS